MEKKYSEFLKKYAHVGNKKRHLNVQPSFKWNEDGEMTSWNLITFEQVLELLLQNKLKFDSILQMQLMSEFLGKQIYFNIRRILKIQGLEIYNSSFNAKVIDKNEILHISVFEMLNSQKFWDTVKQIKKYEMMKKLSTRFLIYIIRVLRENPNFKDITDNYQLVWEYNNKGTTVEGANKLVKKYLKEYIGSSNMLVRLNSRRDIQKIIDKVSF